MRFANDLLGRNDCSYNWCEVVHKK